jgi:hypothetical protein
LGVVFQNLFDRRAGSEEIEKQGDPDPRAANAWLAEADPWVHRNPAQNLIHRPITSRSSGYQRCGRPRHWRVARRTGGKTAGATEKLERRSAGGLAAGDFSAAFKVHRTICVCNPVRCFGTIDEADRNSPQCLKSNHGVTESTE